MEKNVFYPKYSRFVWKFTEENVDNHKFLINFISNNKSAIQFAYSTTYPFVYSSTENRKINMKSEFQINFNDLMIRNKKNIRERFSS